MGENHPAIIINRQQKITLRIQGQPTDILAMRQWQCEGLVAKNNILAI